MRPNFGNVNIRITYLRRNVFSSVNAFAHVHNCGSAQTNSFVHINECGLEKMKSFVVINGRGSEKTKSFAVINDRGLHKQKSFVQIFSYVQKNLRKICFNYKQCVTLRYQIINTQRK